MNSLIILVRQLSIFFFLLFEVDCISFPYTLISLHISIIINFPEKKFKILFYLIVKDIIKLSYTSIKIKFSCYFDLINIFTLVISLFCIHREQHKMPRASSKLSNFKQRCTCKARSKVFCSLFYFNFFVNFLFSYIK
jgi:hypothetical protein